MPHDVTLPPDVTEAIVARRGRVSAFDRFAPERTALLVVDMQVFFVGLVPMAATIVPNINRLARACRQAGAQVVFIITTLAERPGAPSLWPLYHEHFFTPEAAARHRQGLTAGEPAHALFGELDVAAGEAIVEKRRFSAFVEGASDLHARLRGNGIDNLIVTGTLTNMCCESTARDAMMLDYRVAVVGDAMAARSDAEHLGALVSLAHGFAEVRDTDGAIALLR